MECRLLELFDLANDLIEIRPLVRGELGMDELIISANLERAAAGWNQRERRDAIAEFKNFGRQTDGLRRVVSDDAIFDGDFCLQRELSFPGTSVRKPPAPVNCRSCAFSILEREVDAGADGGEVILRSVNHAPAQVVSPTDMFGDSEFETETELA